MFSYFSMSSNGFKHGSICRRGPPTHPYHLNNVVCIANAKPDVLSQFKRASSLVDQSRQAKRQEPTHRPTVESKCRRHSLCTNVSLFTPVSLSLCGYQAHDQVGGRTDITGECGTPNPLSLISRHF